MQRIQIPAALEYTCSQTPLKRWTASADCAPAPSSISICGQVPVRRRGINMGDRACSRVEPPRSERHHLPARAR